MFPQTSRLEAERKRVEEARCREENRQRKEQEIRLVKELVNKAEDYRIAKEIREYIQAMIDSGNEDITPEWIEWALKKRKNLCKTVSERAGIGKNEWRQFDG